MANYNVSSLNLSVKQSGSTSGSGQLQVPSSGTITITPKPGFVVQAADFGVSLGAINSTNPISSTSLADSGTALEVGNTVVITLTFNSGFSMPTADTIKNLTISGNSRILTADGGATSTTFNFFLKNVPFNITVKNLLELDDDGVVTSTPLTITSFTSLNSGITVGSVGDGVSDIDITGNITFNPDFFDTGSSFQDVATFVVSAPAGKAIENVNPKFIPASNNLDFGAVRIIRTSITEDGNGNALTGTYKIIADVRQEILTDTASIIITGFAQNLLPTTKFITTLTFGSSFAPVLGATRIIEVFGDVGATFKIKVVNTADVNDVLLLDEKGVIPARLVDNAQGTKRYRIEIKPTTVNRSYKIEITPTGDTERAGQLGDFHNDIKQLTINQFANPVFKLAFTKQTSPTAGYADLEEVKMTGRPFALGKDVPHVKDSTGVTYESVIEVERVIKTNTGSFTFNAANFKTNSSGFFQVGTISGAPSYTAHKYNPKLVQIHGLKLTLSNTDSSNDTATLKFVVLINQFDNQDLTYQINLPEFLTHGS